MTAAVRSVVVRRPGPPEAMATGWLPRAPLGDRDLRVRVAAAGVNPVDAQNRADPGWAELEPPYVVGYELAGTVLEAGPDVTGHREGDEVWAMLAVRRTQLGAYADEVVVAADVVARRPRALSVQEAAAVPLAGSTAVQLLDRLQPQPGEWILVNGAGGGVGHLLVQLARRRGARVAALASARRHELLHRLGVDAVVDRHHADALAAAQEAAGGPFALAADLAGDLETLLGAVGEGGRAATIVGLTGDLDAAIDRNITLHGVLVRPDRATLDALARAVDEQGARPEIDEVLELDDAVRAHVRIEAGDVHGKLVLACAR